MIIFNFYLPFTLIPVAARCKAFLCGRSLAGIVGSNPAGTWMDGCLSLVSVICCRVEVSIAGRSLVQRSPNERSVSECDLETSSKRRPRSTKTVKP